MITTDPSGRLHVEVDQTVRDLDGNLLAYAVVEHVYTMRSGGVARFDIGPPQQRRVVKRRRVTERTMGLAMLRGALLDLLATRDTDRVTAAMDLYLRSLQQPLE